MTVTTSEGETPLAGRPWGSTGSEKNGLTGTKKKKKKKNEWRAAGVARNCLPAGVAWAVLPARRRPHPALVAAAAGQAEAALFLRVLLAPF